MSQGFLTSYSSLRVLFQELQDQVFGLSWYQSELRLDELDIFVLDFLYEIMETKI